MRVLLLTTNTKNAAEAALDTFDDDFLGSKSSNPSVDNDGNALADGALYFDTTNNVMKVYDLGNTQWKQLTPTSSQQTNIDAAVSNAYKYQIMLLVKFLQQIILQQLLEL